MAMAVSAEMIIPSGVVPPIAMAIFPAMETIQTVRIGDDPDVAGSQIIILAAHETDVFIAIPNVFVRNHYRLRNRGIHHRRLNLHHHGLEGQTAIGFDDAAGR